VLPLGKVGLLTGEGGVSKTMAVCALAISVASHELHPWLGCFSVSDQGRVLLLLGEEEAKEAQRRLYNTRMAIGAPVPELGLDRRRPARRHPGTDGRDRPARQPTRGFDRRTPQHRRRGDRRTLGELVMFSIVKSN